MGVRAIVTITETSGTATLASARFWSGWASPDFQIPHLADFYGWSLRELAPLNLASYRAWAAANPGTLPADELLAADTGEPGDLDYRYELTLNPDEHGLRLAVYDLTDRHRRPQPRGRRQPVTVLTHAVLYRHAARCCDTVAGRADHYADSHDGQQLPHADPAAWRERAEQFRQSQQGAAMVAVEANLAAVFHPATFDAPRRALQVAGVLVFAYVDGLGELRVSVHLDEAEAWLREDADTVPMRITVQDTDVFHA
jgi:hypothetical protein